MGQITPHIGNGHFQWNTGAWFGGMVGGNVYLLVGAVFLARTTLLMAAIWLACWLVATTAGIVIWRRRTSVAPYPAMQLQTMISGLMATAAILALLLTDQNLPINMQVPGKPTLAVLLLFPTLMLQFYLAESQASPKPTPPAPTGQASGDDDDVVEQGHAADNRRD